MADLEDKKVSQLESGTVTSNSVFLDSGNGVSTKVGSQDVANFVGKTHAFSGSGGLNTTAKTLVGAINEVAGSAGKSNLADMDDVNIDDETLEGGQGLVYDDTNDEWVNGEVASALESLTDVDIDSTSLADGQAIVYDETNDKWVNGTVSGGASVVQKTMAEYTALPSSEKMNGSIYKITDKALIYCLDEEYHAVKEITSADYALLTSAEKNNGTLYIITDEETTAVDIPYSAGVSVADKINAMDYTEGSSGVWHYKKYNNGIMEMWGYSAQTMQPQVNAWGSWYACEIASLGSYPVAFTAIHSIVGTVTITSASGFGEIKEDITSLTTAPTYIFARPTTLGVENRTVVRTLYVRGTWN